MQSLRTGLAFCRQVWRVARRAPECLQPSTFGILAGVVVTLLTLIPIGLAADFLRKGIAGILLVTILGTLLLCVQVAIGELSALVTTDRFYRHFVPGEESPQKAVSLLGRSALDWLIFAAASFVITIQQRQRERQPAGVKPEEAWLEATYLVMPLMVIEKLSLKDSLPRITQLVKEHSLLGKEGLIGVQVLNRVVYVVLGGIALVVALLVNGLVHWALGDCLAIFLASLFSLAAIFLAAFNRAAYHACLYGGTQFNEAGLKGKLTGPAWAREMVAAALGGVVH